MDDPVVSKSERKRQALHLQTLGQELARLRPDQLEGLELPERLLRALLDYQRFPSHGARRRQLQYVGKLMRDADIEPIEAALAALNGESADARYQLHLVEQWRDRLLANAAALTDFLNEYPGADRQQLRHALQRIDKATDDTSRKAATRALFRQIRELTIPQPEHAATQEESTAPDTAPDDA